MSWRHRSGLASCLLVLAGCDVQPPGELIGEYSVNGALTENTCGAEALPANDPLQFQVQIRQDEFNALWLLEPPARPGTLEDGGDFDFEVETAYPVDPSARQDTPALFAADPEAFTDEAALEAIDPATRATGSCTLVVVERMRGTLRRDLNGARDDDPAPQDGESSSRGSEPDLTGDNEIEIRAASGSDCGLVLRTAGGPFDALPCHAHYDIQGSLLPQ